MFVLKHKNRFQHYVIQLFPKFTLMKILPFLLLFYLVALVVNAQSIRPGVYRYKKNQNEAVLTINENEATVSAWQMTVKCSKVSDSRYYNATTTDFIEFISPDEIMLGNEQYNFKDELVMYAPDDDDKKEGVTEFKWNGGKYYAVIDSENKQIVGEYTYEGKGKEPKVLLNNNLSGYFQRHQVAPDPLTWWGIETNYKGEVQKITYENGNQKMILVVKYNTGEYDRMEVGVFTSENKSVIMGERILYW